MKLKYISIDQVKSEYVSINALNGTLGKMVENDQTILSSIGDGIGIWEKKWYNDDQLDGYEAGHAVWINTDPPETFTRNHQQQIVDYVLGSKYKDEYSRISSDSQRAFEFLLDICEGRNGYDRLFYLGSISSAAQIRISLRDNNKALPDDDSSWCDALRLSTEQDYESQISTLALSADSSSIAQHVASFHLSGMSVHELTSGYLLTSMSNLKAEQSYRTHVQKLRPETMNGFDEIAKFKFDEGDSRWAKLWKSGYLEQGGVVYVPSSATSVDIKLEYQYDYSVAYDQFYPFGYRLEIGDDQVSPRSDTLGQAGTYEIEVTPISDGGYGFEPPEILNVCNDGFSVAVHPGTRKLRYSAAGFVTSTTMGRYL